MSQTAPGVVKSRQQRASLRVCASCEWIYRGPADCPQCGFASYGAHWVYGSVCYDHEKTQKPWMERKLSAYRRELLSQIPRPAAKTVLMGSVFGRDD